MAVFKCKMCGGDLEILENATVCECEYCGTTQTVPVVDDEKKLSLFTRANKLRFNNEFDKAAGVYESIVADFPEEAEGYWGLVLCKYGIEYVDDPATGKKIPTCHRSSFDSVMDDSDFELVLENADAVSRKVYRDEAKAIEELRKSIVEVSSTEEPYDIFICYKETDENGDRTIDSEIAQDVYTALTEKGYRVFFSRITLEDKLGQEYEPYIFAALNSAKVMLAFGTDYEYYNAVWVKNEWSRFLKLIQKGEKKTLIPCYKNIDAYDMPKEFAKLQAQDMGKVGAIQDLVRGVEKLLPKNAESTTVKETVVVNSGANATVDSLLERVFMFLEDGDFSSANEYCEKVLDIDPKNALAYLGKLMADLEVKKKKDLVNCKDPFDKNANYEKIVRFGDEELKNELAGYLKTIKLRNIENAYQMTISAMQKAKTSKEFEKIAKSFEMLKNYKESEKLCVECKEKVETFKQKEAEKKKKLYDQRVKSDKASKFISAGWWHTVGLKSDGTVVAVGKNKSGQCDVKGWTDIVAISVSSEHTVGLKSDGTVVAVGENEKGQCNVDGWTDIVAIYARSSHTVGLKSDGTVVAVGNNQRGQCDVQGWTDIVAISAGSSQTVGLKSDGTVVAKYTGKIGYDNGQCKVQDWTDIVAVYTGTQHTVGLKSDGTVVAVGYNGSGQCDVQDWTDIVAVYTGSSHTVGLKLDGTVVAVGDNEYGECDVQDWKLFDDFENLEEEQKTKMAEQKRIAEEKKRIAKEQKRIEEERIAAQKAQYRSQGLCQHCGGELKGLLTKKCANCGKPKDY